MYNKLDFVKEKVILRDYLALERTYLASERTLLAYLRTAVGLFASGLGLIKLLDERFFVVLGFVFIVISPIVVIVGITRIILVKARLKKITIESNKLQAYCDSNVGVL